MNTNTGPDQVKHVTLFFTMCLAVFARYDSVPLQVNHMN
jgi:hypothetical protein